MVWMALIFYLSAQSSLPPLPGFAGIDKIQHGGAYVILGLLLYRAMRSTPYTLALGALYGASDEIHQRFVPGRHMSGWDWLTDIAGLAIAMAAVAVIAKYRANGGTQHGRRRKGIRGH